MKRLAKISLLPLFMAAAMASSVYLQACGSVSTESKSQAPQASVTCGAGLSLCSSTCVNLQGDALNCGACGSACPEGQSCQSGACSGSGGSGGSTGGGSGGSTGGGGGSSGGTTCVSGKILCGGNCTDPLVDNNNCGACGTVCGTGKSCFNGQCVANATVVPCPSAGFTRCSGAAGCVNLLSDNGNCGACGVACSGGASCYNGQCITVSPPSCPAGESMCGGMCVNLQTDRLNCGSCGNQCGASIITIVGLCLTGVCM